MMLDRTEDQAQLENKENTNNRPYVVSEDIRILLNEWAVPRGFKLPDEGCFRELRSEFTAYMGRIFPGFELVPETELVEGLSSRVDNSGLLPVTLDRVYYRSNLSLGLTRMVDRQGRSRGLGRRPDRPYLREQFRRLQQVGIRQIALVDDVIFSGDMINRVVRLLTRMGVETKAVYTGIAIGEGIDLLAERGVTVDCVRRYPEVIDEICERDFYPGVPLSGRTIECSAGEGAPYILPFGRPGQWASIPDDWQLPLSRFCLSQTIRLFEAIEQASQRPVRYQDLERPVALPVPAEDRFADCLRRLLD